MRKLILVAMSLAGGFAAAAADYAPALQWIKTVGGSGKSAVAGITADAAGNLYIAGSTASTASASNQDAFAVKLDNDGNVVYLTTFGGSGNDNAAALALGSDGSIYVAGSTNSPDLPVTPGAYLATMPSGNGAASFLFKLDPNGSLAWATYFATPGSSVQTIAVDSQGNAYLGGTSRGGLTTTPGAYQTSFTQYVGSNGFFGVFGPPSGFVTKFNSKGTGLVYSTYVSTDKQNNTVAAASALTVDASGNLWIGVNNAANLGPSAAAGHVSIVELNAAGSDVIASANQAGLGGAQAIALDANSNVYIAGAYNGVVFAATPGAFQATAQPAMPNLDYEPVAGGGTDAFIAKFDSSLSHLLAATLLGGEAADNTVSIAFDPAGNVIVGGNTNSYAFPTHTPFQTAFAAQSGFVAGLDPTLSHLEFSTYLGGAPFTAGGAALDPHGNILLAGNTAAGQIVANKIALPPAPALRLDSIENYASRIAAPLAPDEPILAIGAGLGPDAQIVLDGTPLATWSSTATSIVAVMPAGAATSGPHTLQVSSGGASSNPLYVPAAAASPAIYSVDGSGFGQGYILNSDGTLNSPSNPAAPGSAITLFVAAPGPYTLTNGYAVTAAPPAVFLDGGIFCNGIAAVVRPVDDLPGNVYQIGVYIPTVASLAAQNPDLKNYTYPAQTGIQIAMGTRWQGTVDPTTNSQNGVFVSIK